MILLRRLILLATTLYWALLIYLMHTPRPPAFAVLSSDKVAHFLAYGMLSGLLFVTLWAVRPKMRWIGVYVLAFALIYGAMDEWTQPLTGRTCDLWDWICDAGGSAIAVGVLSVLRIVIGRYGKGTCRMTKSECLRNDE